MEHNETRFVGWELLGEECETILAPGHHPHLATFTRRALMFYAHFIGKAEATECLFEGLPVEDAHRVWVKQFDDMHGCDGYWIWQTDPRSDWSRGTILCLQGQEPPAIATVPERCVTCGEWEWPDAPHDHQYGPPKPADPLWDRLIDKRTYG